MSFICTSDARTSVSFFFFNDTATTEIYTLSLHDALPIWLPEMRLRLSGEVPPMVFEVPPPGGDGGEVRGKTVTPAIRLPKACVPVGSVPMKLPSTLLFDPRMTTALAP